jgi:hypothetical protein
LHARDSFGGETWAYDSLYGSTPSGELHTAMRKRAMAESTLIIIICVSCLLVLQYTFPRDESGLAGARAGRGVAAWLSSVNYFALGDRRTIAIATGQLQPPSLPSMYSHLTFFL